MGLRGSPHDTLACATTEGPSASDSGERFTIKRSSSHLEAAADEHEDKGIEWKEATWQHHRLSSPDDSIPKINEQLSAIHDHRRVLSNPKLARLISSFPQPRFRKFANEPQSLAEYHKQEFRKKFQGNEHYLRKHLYRENMEKKGAVMYQRTLAMKEDIECSLQGDQEEQRIKEENDDFTNCFREDYMLDRISPTHESFRRGETGGAPRYHFQVENLLLNESLNSNVPSSTETKETLITRGYLTLNNYETQHVNNESRAARECTCQEHDSDRSVAKQPKRLTAKEEKDAAHNIATDENEECSISTSPSKQLGPLETQTNLTRLGSYYVYQRTQRDYMSSPQHVQCHCYSTPSLYAPKENIIRYHEPAFLVDPMYHYPAYPRLLPYFAHQTTNSPQSSPRNQGFTCEYCGKVYCRKYVLKIHMRTHTGFKPLRCKVCDKSFSDPSNMKKHVKLHENEDTVHKCRYCGRNFVRYRGLLNHIKSKHSEHLPITDNM